MAKRLVIGCGYLGKRVALAWRAAGHDVYAVSRSERRAAELEAEGLRPVIADITQPSTLDQLPQADEVLFAVGFDRAAGHSIGEVYVDGLRNVLEAMPLETGRLVYVSSTGVYAQNDGSWVDEEAVCEPTRESARACLAAEQLLIRDEQHIQAVILRLAGIYGPGRVPRGDDLRAGRPIPSPADGFLNLIHVDDAVRVINAAVAARQDVTRIFNVSDGHPVVRRDYFLEVVRLLDAPPPTFDQPSQASGRQQRAASSKRVSNRRMLDELEVRLEYPSFREGLAAIVRGL